MRRPISCRDNFCLRHATTFLRRSSSDCGEPCGLMETPPSEMPPRYCITYAEVNSIVMPPTRNKRKPRYLKKAMANENVIQSDGNPQGAPHVLAPAVQIVKGMLTANPTMIPRRNPFRQFGYGSIVISQIQPFIEGAFVIPGSQDFLGRNGRPTLQQSPSAAEHAAGHGPCRFSLSLDSILSMRSGLFNW